MIDSSARAAKALAEDRRLRAGLDVYPSRVAPRRRRNPVRGPGAVWVGVPFASFLAGVMLALVVAALR